MLQLKVLESRSVQGWLPTTRFAYGDGTPFMKKEKFNSVDELFTRRNLQALAWLHAAIQDEPNDQLRSFLMSAFTSMVHLCTRMMPLGNPQPTNHYTFFSLARLDATQLLVSANLHGAERVGKVCFCCGGQSRSDSRAETPFRQPLREPFAHPSLTLACRRNRAWPRLDPRGLLEWCKGLVPHAQQ